MAVPQGGEYVAVPARSWAAINAALNAGNAVGDQTKLALAYVSKELVDARNRIDALEWAVQKAAAQLPEDPKRALATLLAALPQ